MADYSASDRSPVITGTAGTADKVRPTGSLNAVLLEVLNVNGADVISFTVDGTAAVSGAAENYCLPAIAGQALQVPVVAVAGGHARVSVITPSSNTKYAVSLVPSE